MKELSLEKMETVKGGKECSTYTGVAVGAGIGLILIGAATGGIGFAVAGGLMAYFGTGATILCALY